MSSKPLFNTTIPIKYTKITDMSCEVAFLAVHLAIPTLRLQPVLLFSKTIHIFFGYFDPEMIFLDDENE